MLARMASDPPGKLPPLPKLPGIPRVKTMAPTPTPDGFMSTSAMMSLADIALQLRDEQLEAKVIHYKAELETSPELDAVTAQVIAELQDLQAAARRASPQSRPPPSADRAQVEVELVQNLKTMLARIFKKERLATTIQRSLGEVAKRFARVFFESELHDKLRGEGEEAKVMRFAEQALYHAFARTQDQLLATLQGYQYASPKVLEMARARFGDYVKELRNGFLARTTPELNLLVKYLNEVLTRFFTEAMPVTLGDLAREVVRDARLAEARTSAAYKISASAFKPFRQAFERRFLQRLVPFVEAGMLERVRTGEAQFRTETIRLVADPLIFSDVCEVVCDAVYDMLYNDGFLDLPSDWRRRLSSPAP
jgi:hypothetical protein